MVLTIQNKKEMTIDFRLKQLKKIEMNKYFKWLIWLVGFIPGIYLAANWNSLPEKVALHFDLKGNPDRYGDKTELLVVVAVLSLMTV